MVVNIEAPRCQDNSDRLNTQYQAEHMEKSAKGSNDDSTIEDKNVNVRILEWIIKRNLYYKYQNFVADELEERLESRKTFKE
jgi:hypothetical protein